MKVGIMQPYFFPYIGYWQLIDVVDVFVIFDDVNYIKRGYINRNSILVSSEPHRITLEVLKASQNKLINEINLGLNRKKILKNIEQAYKKAPYFTSVFPLIQNVFEYYEVNLAKFLGNTLIQLMKYLDIETKVIYSSDIEKDNSLKAGLKIMDICQKVGVDQYINPIGGQDLYNKDSFLSKGIRLNFIKTEIIEYKQFHNNFIPYLSIIDVMMFNSQRDIKSMLDKYTLI